MMKIFCSVVLVAAGVFQGEAQDLFQKYDHNPLFDVGNELPSWRSIHAANVTILYPEETPDGKWRMYLRGSGNVATGYHDQIGMFDQDTEGFGPYGPWEEYAGNPVLAHGPEGAYDEWHLLDAAARQGEDGKIYLYYKGVKYNNGSNLSGAVSTDGGFTFTKFETNPLKSDVGPNDVVYEGGKYYLFYGDAQWNGSSFSDHLQIWVAVSDRPDELGPNLAYAIEVGRPGDYDAHAVNGGKIFKVPGDDRWFMVYQTSSFRFDYPDRFHAAYSTDLLDWTKVDNPVPLMTRGELGEWDQGGIWTGSVIVHGDSLYIYYEGWGSFNKAYNRDQEYYSGGQSRVGVAAVSAGDFLAWAAGDTDVVEDTPENDLEAIEPGKIYRIVNKNSNKSLTIEDAASGNGAVLVQSDYRRGNDQHFQIREVAPGYYRIRLANSNKSLDVYAAATKNNGKVVQWDYLGAANQQWAIYPVDGEYHAIINRNSGKSLDVYGLSQENGAQVVQWEFLEENNQLWQFAEAEPPLAIVEPEALHVYPNPASHTINIDLSKYREDVQIELLGVDGRLIRSRKVSAAPSLATIDVRNMSGQLVIVRVSAGHLLLQRKVVIR